MKKNTRKPKVNALQAKVDAVMTKLPTTAILLAREVEQWLLDNMPNTCQVLRALDDPNNNLHRIVLQCTSGKQAEKLMADAQHSKATQPFTWFTVDAWPSVARGKTVVEFLLTPKVSRRRR